MGIVITFILGLIVGIAIGFFVVVLTRYYPIGILHCDRTDPDGPHLFLELNESIGEITKLNYVTLQVDHNDDISQI